ncbi:MAG: hypothetical protein KA369_23705 [Spirochaetes bacterium]|nr:hypothetical protein [Spirochaetota bacterium]
MALITCMECNKEMSDTLEACPHCGFKRSIKNTSEKPTFKPSSNFTICVSCKQPYYKGARKCPYCKTINMNKNLNNNNLNKKKSYVIPAAITGFFVLIILYAIIVSNDDIKTTTNTNQKTKMINSVTSDNANSNSRIKYTVGGYMAATTEELLDRVTELSVAKDYDALQQLLNSGMVIALKDGVKVEIVKMGFTVVKFRIFGTNTELWTVVEALKGHP